MSDTNRTAKITVLVPGPLQSTCGGASELPLSVGTLREVLDRIEQEHPSLYRSVCDDTGSVRRHVNLFINKAHMRDREGLDTVLKDGDEVFILPAVSGG